MRTLADLREEYNRTGGLSSDDFTRYMKLRREEYTEAQRSRKGRRGDT